MVFFIKNMVCNRCILVVNNIFESMGYPPSLIILGEVETSEPLSVDEIVNLRESLNSFGFELIDDSKSLIIEKIKTIVIEMVHHSEDKIKVNFSSLIETKLNKDYTYLSNLFSDVTGITIEKYVINQKIEKVKELLVYDELTLSEISYQLGYSSVSHLSAQFKKITGLTPGHFKMIKEKKRKPLDKV